MNLQTEDIIAKNAKFSEMKRTRETCANHISCWFRNSELSSFSAPWAVPSSESGMSPRPHHRTALASTIASIFAAIVCGTSAHAAVIYSESFDYGATNGSLEGQNGGTGFSEAWTAGNPGITYSAAGLTFSDFSVSGGMATATGSNGIGSAILTRPLDNWLNGRFYGSFLSQVLATSEFSISSGMALGPQDISHGEKSLGILAPSNTDALMANSGDFNTSNGSTLTQGQTYLTLFKIGVSEISGWTFSADQYDMFKIGGITEAELNSADIGTGNSQLWARASVSHSTFTMSHLTILMNATDGVNATLASDEFRLSDTGFNEILIAIPEPSSMALLALGAGLLTASRRRR